MRNGDGLSRKSRIERVTSITPFHIIRNDMVSLLSQAETIASFIRYYDFRKMPAGYWDELLEELKKIHECYKTIGTFPQPDQGMEPAQAVLLIFLRQLHKLNAEFNNRWKKYPYWFLNEVLGIRSLTPLPDRVWVRFRKNVPGTVTIPKEECFRTLTKEDEKSFIYRLEQDFEVKDLYIEKAFSVYFEKRKHMFPASRLNAVTSLKVKDLIHEESGRRLMFGEDQNQLHAQSTGFMIISPSLVMREGKRSVTITFEAENIPLTSYIINHIDPKAGLFDFTSEENKYARLLDNIFYLQISTAEGWRAIRGYTTRSAEDCRDDIVLKFTLEENFPATMACNNKDHNFESDYPALKVLLNLDAWLYPYTWIKEFLLRRIRIYTSVEGATNLLIYNELGRIDNSRPFQPFGLNTEKGTWFGIGNYEMAIRPSLKMNVRIQWGALPENEYGLKEYYREYDSDIDNRSFRIRPRYLTDYVWHQPKGKNYYLFATSTMQSEDGPAPDLPLIRETCWMSIPIDKMTRIILPEDLYEYSIQSKTGFVSFMLDEPAIGFGEKRYRYMFTNQMLRNAWKKKEQILLNPPLVPVIERITIDYESEEIIDLRTYAVNEPNSFYHLFPLGHKRIFPSEDNQSVSLVYALESDANIMFGVRDAKGGEFMRLFIDFIPVNKEIAELKFPEIKWYYGDGYTWKKMPDSVIENDTTRSLLMRGCIDFFLPEDIDSYQAPQTGLTWIRAGISEHYDFIPDLIGIYTNTAELVLNMDDPENECWYDYRKKEREILPIRNIPGITKIDRISAFYGGREKETDLNKFIRVSEYVTHRGKAVTPRDYERIILQNFTAIGKVKCLPDLDTKEERNGVVTLVVIPENDKMTLSGWRPKASANLILEIEESLRQQVSATVTAVDVINPEYEELMVRCRISFRKNYSSSACRRRLKELCDRMIAPWQSQHEIPSFDYSLRLQILYEFISEQEYIRSVDELSVIRLTEKKEEYYVIHEYKGKDEIIYPSEPYAIFVPAREHLFLTETETTFGISEMTIDETFVIE